MPTHGSARLGNPRRTDPSPHTLGRRLSRSACYPSQCAGSSSTPSSSETSAVAFCRPPTCEAPTEPCFAVAAPPSSAQDLLGMTTDNASRAGMLNEWQRHIDDAHRAWSGTDTRDPRIIYLRDLELTRSTLPVGPNAKVDLSPIRASVDRAVLRELDPLSAPRQAGRRVPAPHGGSDRRDPDCSRYTAQCPWPTGHGCNRQRDPEALAPGSHPASPDRPAQQVRGPLPPRRGSPGDSWGDIPSTFAVDLAKHRPRGTKSRTRDGDDAFRFVPQPIIDHLMDNLTLVQRRTPYLTAEARVMLFLQERCGRRTTETVRLKDDCISYDNQGSPYLEWERCKPPYTMGKRLPIHQETHDVIRKWQQIKRDHAIESRWLFPSHVHRPGVDKPWNSTYLQARVQDLVAAVLEKAPYEGPAEGPEGNLIHFDLTKLDAYSFRHAFAQRFADATDAEGRSTTPPDVLQEYMGHSSFNTTMAYFKVTAKTTEEGPRSSRAAPLEHPWRGHQRGSGARWIHEGRRVTRALHRAPERRRRWPRLHGRPRV
jgi:integrase